MRAIRLPSPINGIGHAAPITHVTFSHDGSRLATSSYDGHVVIWDSHDPTRLRNVARLAHRRLVNSAAWHPHDATRLATASADKTVTVWQVAADGTVDVISALAHHTDDINSVAWLPDGRRLACVSEDGKATLWDTVRGALLGTLVTHAGHCMMVAVSSQGWLSTVGEDGLVTVFCVDGDETPIRRTYEGSVEGCAWSHDGTRLAVAKDDGCVDILGRDLTTIRSIQVSTSAARSVAWLADDAAIVVGAYDAVVRVFGLDGNCRGQFYRAGAWPRSVAAGAGMVAVGSFWSLPHLLDANGMTEIPGAGVPTHGPNALAVRGSSLLIGCDSGAIFEIDIPSITEGRKGGHRIHRATDVPILSLTATEDAMYAGTFSCEIVRITETEKQVRHVGAPVPSLLTQGSLIAGGTYQGELVILDAQTLEIVRRNQAHQGSIKSMAHLSSDRFVSGATDRVVTVGDLDDRVPLWEHGNLINAVTALGGQVVASASRDHTVKVGRIYATQSGAWPVERLQTLLGPDESVKAITLLGTADHPVVLAGSYDFGLYAWQVDWEKPGASLRTGSVVTMFDQAVSHMCRIDENTAAVASWSGKIAIVRLQGEQVIVVGEIDLARLAYEEMVSS